MKYCLVFQYDIGIGPGIKCVCSDIAAGIFNNALQYFYIHMICVSNLEIKM